MKKEYQLLNNNNNNKNKNPSNNQICKLEKNKTKKINVNASYLIFRRKELVPTFSRDFYFGP